MGRPGEVSMVSENYAQRLIQAVQALSMARSLDALVGVVRHASCSVPSATFVLRDGEQRFYRTEDT
jgi:hypothetical protein